MGKFIRFINKLFVKNNPGHHVCAIILAAGKGTRMNSDTVKQHIALGSVPVICRTLSLFQSCEFIDDIIVVVPKEDAMLYAGYKSLYSLTKLSGIIEGGRERRDSVKNGLDAVPANCDFVIIHDGVRCLVKQEEILSVLESSFRYGAAIAAIPEYDTVKIADKDGFIKRTVDRRLLWRAQTPQAFKKSLILSSVYSHKGAAVTDDASFAELSGFKVKLVECGCENIKITTRSDLDLAEAILKKRGLSDG